MHERTPNYKTFGRVSFSPELLASSFSVQYTFIFLFFVIYFPYFFLYTDMPIIHFKILNCSRMK